MSKGDSCVCVIINSVSTLIWMVLFVVLTCGPDVGVNIIVCAHNEHGKIVRDYYMDTTDFCSSDGRVHNFSLAINEIIHIHGIHAASRVPSFPPKACSQGYHGKVARYFVIEIENFKIRNCDVTLTILHGLNRKYSLLRDYNCHNYTSEVLHIYADAFIFILGKKYTRTSMYYFDIKLSTLDPGASFNGYDNKGHAVNIWLLSCLVITSLTAFRFPFEFSPR